MFPFHNTSFTCSKAQKQLQHPDTMELRNRNQGGRRDIDGRLTNVSLGPTIYAGERYSKASERLKRQQKNGINVDGVADRVRLRQSDACDWAMFPHHTLSDSLIAHGIFFGLLLTGISIDAGTSLLRIHPRARGDVRCRVLAHVRLRRQEAQVTRRLGNGATSLSLCLQKYLQVKNIAHSDKNDTPRKELAERTLHTSKHSKICKKERMLFSFTR